MSSTEKPEGMLVILHDVVLEQAAAIRDWYAREHHFERLAVPGFLEARRFDRIEGTGSAVLGLYRVDCAAVLRSPPYMARLAAPSAWTQSVMPHFRAMSRTVCDVSAQEGRAEGGHLAAVAATTGIPLPPQSLRAALQEVPGVLRWCSVAAAPKSSGPVSAETGLRGGPDDRITWAVFVDTDGPESAGAALTVLQRLAKGVDLPQSAVYRLAFAARRHAH